MASAGDPACALWVNTQKESSAATRLTNLIIFCFLPELRPPRHIEDMAGDRLGATKATSTPWEEIRLRKKLLGQPTSTVAMLDKGAL
jgi:hypothetical protein